MLTKIVMLFALCATDEALCGFPSAMFEFFSIASEAWFLCNGLDLYYSVTNPFSSLKNR